MANLALIVYRHSPGIRERRLGRILEFFGVPCQTIDLANLSEAARAARETSEYAILASVDVAAAALAMEDAAVSLRAIVPGCDLNGQLFGIRHQYQDDGEPNYLTDSSEPQLLYVSRLRSLPNQ